MKTYDFNAANLELTQMAIQRYKAVTSLDDFRQARLLATGIDIRFLRFNPDLDAALTLVYEEACARIGIAQGISPAD